MQKGLNSYTWTIPEYVTVTDPATGNTYNIYINGGSYAILVTINQSGTGSYDYSDNTFAINPLTLTSPAPTTSDTACSRSTGNVRMLVPNGGESYRLGNVMNIRLCVNDYSQYNKNYSSLWLTTKDSSGVYRNQLQIAYALTMMEGENTYIWTIPSTVFVGGNYMILVQINSFYPNYDYSDATFSITP